MSLYNHVEIWKDRPQMWPKGIYCNGHIMVDAEKMVRVYVCVREYVCVCVCTCVCVCFLILPSLRLHSHPLPSPTWSAFKLTPHSNLYSHIHSFLFSLPTYFQAKSKGNFLMLLESVEEYSADATRFALADAGDRYVRTCVCYF